MTAPDIHTVRQAFADDIVKTAAECASGEELICRLSSIGQPRYSLGLGHTRQTWQLDHGLVLKVAREDSMGRMERMLQRRNANFVELISSLTWPSITPRIYGALCAFGLHRANPSILVSEQVSPISDNPDVRVNQLLSLGHHLFVSITTGKLSRTIQHWNDIPLNRLLGFPDLTPISPLNIGINSDGDTVILDIAGFMTADIKMDEVDFEPIGLDGLRYSPPLGGYESDRHRNAHISAHLLKVYQARLHSVQDDVLNVFPLKMRLEIQDGRVTPEQTALQSFSDALIQAFSNSVSVRSSRNLKKLWGI